MIDVGELNLPTDDAGEAIKNPKFSEQMNRADGVMIFHARSQRLESFDELPGRIKREVREKYPVYLTAPEKVDPNAPNETSWTFYEKEMKKREKK